MLAAVFEPANYLWNAFALPLLVTAAAMFLLGAMVMVRERGSREARQFAFLATTICIWLSCFSLMYLAKDPRVALAWAKSAYLGIAFIPTALYHFTVIVTRSRRRRLAWAAWAVSALFFAVTASSGALLRDLYHYWWGYYPHFRWLGAPFLAFFFAMLALSLRGLWLDYRQAAPGTTHSVRTRLLLAGGGLAYLGSCDYVAAYGLPLYPFGYLPVFVFIIVVAKTIQRYRLVDLTPAFAAEQILATVADPVIVCDREGRIRFVNEAAASVFGYAAGELAGAPIELLAPPSPGMAGADCIGKSMLHHYTDRWARTALLQKMRAQGGLADEEVGLVRIDGAPAWVVANAMLGTPRTPRAPLASQGDAQEVLEGTVIDITQRKNAERQIVHQAYHDALTGLPNRMLFYDRLTQALNLARRDERGLAVLFLDLDQFKLVNDTLGHAAGDRLLVEIARRLQNTVRNTDSVARVGGDEFTLLLRQIDHPTDAARTAQKILAAVPRPVDLDGHQLFITTSIGISLFPADGEEAEALLTSPDIAMYRAKDLGRNGFQLCTPAMNAKSAARLTLERALRLALYG